MIERRVFVGGEGPNELGSWSSAETSTSNPHPGVIEALLRKAHREGWQIIGGTKWTGIVKLNARGPTPREERNVLGLVESAKRTGANIVAFVRDSDGDHRRAAQIDSAIEKARDLFPEIEVIGGAAVPVLEAWLLALCRKTGTEKLSRTGAQSRLKTVIVEKDTAAMVELVNGAALAVIPKDATRLKAWVARAVFILSGSPLLPDDRG